MRICIFPRSRSLLLPKEEIQLVQLQTFDYEFTPFPASALITYNVAPLDIPVPGIMPVEIDDGLRDLVQDVGDLLLLEKRAKAGVKIS